jgi:hypothetical protein
VGVTRMGEREHYPSDVSDDQRELFELLLPVAKKQPGGASHGSQCERPRGFVAISYDLLRRRRQTSA